MTSSGRGPSPRPNDKAQGSGRDDQDGLAPGLTAASSSAALERKPGVAADTAAEPRQHVPILAQPPDAGAHSLSPRAPRGADWLANLYVQRALAAGMFACIAYAAGRVLLMMHLAAASAIGIAVMASLTYLAALALGGREYGQNYRKYGEYAPRDWALLLVPMVLGLKFVPYLWLGPAVLAADAQRWLASPASFVDVALFYSVFVLFFVWDFGLKTAGDLQQLSLQPGEVAPPTSSPQYYDWLTSPFRFIDHAAAWRRLMHRFLYGGLILLVLIGIVTVPPGQLTNPGRPVVQGLVTPVLLYFVLGLLLASQTSLDRLRTEWLRDRAAIQSGLTSRWLRAGIAMVLLSLAAALLLPTDYSEGVADQLPGLWRLIWPLHFVAGALFGFLDLLIGVLVAILFAPIVALLPATAPDPEAAARPLPFREPESTAESRYPSPLSRAAFLFLLWGVPSIIVVYALWNTWRKRHDLLWLLRGGWRQVLDAVAGGVLELLRGLVRLFGRGAPGLFRIGWVRAFALRPRRRRSSTGSGAAVGGLRSLRGLDPRRLIWYLYSSLVRRADQVGWGRRRSDTPYEYGRRLVVQMPEHGRAITNLTSAYVRARYSPDEVTKADSEAAKRPWRAIRGALQHRRRRRLLSLAWLLGESEHSR